MTEKEKVASSVLRLGIAFAFLYPPIAGFFTPLSWVGYFPVFVRDVFANDALLLYTFSTIEVAVALWILSGKNIFYPSVLASLILIAIVFSNWSQFDILFRDLPIAAMALGLAVLHFPRKKINTAP